MKTETVVVVAVVALAGLAAYYIYSQNNKIKLGKSTISTGALGSLIGAGSTGLSGLITSLENGYGSGNGGSSNDTSGLSGAYYNSDSLSADASV